MNEVRKVEKPRLPESLSLSILEASEGGSEFRQRVLDIRVSAQ